MQEKVKLSWKEIMHFKQLRDKPSADQSLWSKYTYWNISLTTDLLQHIFDATLIFWASPVFKALQVEFSIFQGRSLNQ